MRGITWKVCILCACVSICVIAFVAHAADGDILNYMPSIIARSSSKINISFVNSLADGPIVVSQNNNDFLSIFGTVDAQGVLGVTELYYKDIAASGEVTIKFDEIGNVISVVDSATGYSMIYSYPSETEVQVVVVDETGTHTYAFSRAATTRTKNFLRISPAVAASGYTDLQGSITINQEKCFNPDRYSPKIYMNMSNMAKNALVSTHITPELLSSSIDSGTYSYKWTRKDQTYDQCFNECNQAVEATCNIIDFGNGLLELIKDTQEAISYIVESASKASKAGNYLLMTANYMCKLANESNKKTCENDCNAIVNDQIDVTVYVSDTHITKSFTPMTANVAPSFAFEFPTCDPIMHWIDHFPYYATWTDVCGIQKNISFTSMPVTYQGITYYSFPCWIADYCD